MQRASLLAAGPLIQAHDLGLPLAPCSARRRIRQPRNQTRDGVVAALAITDCP